MLEHNETGQGLASSSWERMLKIGKESGKSEWPDSLTRLLPCWTDSTETN
jgi:hypothetical protein